MILATKGSGLMRLNYCVYVLISLPDTDLYVGYTTDTPCPTPNVASST